MPDNRSVSYVVTVFNKAGYLAPVLEAIMLEHAATGGEIILIDDGSSDGSDAILTRFAAGNPAIIIHSQPNRGVAAATNTGIGMARCPYVRLIDADDVIVPGSTLCLMQALESTACGFAYGRHAVSVGETGDARVTIVKDALRQMLIRQPFIPATTLGRTEILQRVLPLPEDKRTSQDFSLGLRLAALTCFASVDAVCCITPEASGGLSYSKGRMFRDTVLIALREGLDQQWPASIRRLALVRSAGRARNYLRRHRPDARQKIRVVSLLAIVLRMPVSWPYKRLMTYIADAYIAVS